MNLINKIFIALFLLFELAKTMHINIINFIMNIILFIWSRNRSEGDIDALKNDELPLIPGALGLSVGWSALVLVFLTRGRKPRAPWVKGISRGISNYQGFVRSPMQEETLPVIDKPLNSRYPGSLCSPGIPWAR